MISRLKGEWVEWKMNDLIIRGSVSFKMLFSFFKTFRTSRAVSTAPNVVNGMEIPRKVRWPNLATIRMAE